MYKEINVKANELSVFKFSLPNGEKIFVHFRPTRDKEIGIMQICRENKYGEVIDLNLEDRKSEFHNVRNVGL